MTYDETPTEHVFPRTDLERRIAHIWEHALGVESVSVRDNFFDVGGSSIQAYQILADIARELGTHLSAETLLEASTIEEQAALIGEGNLKPEGSLVPFRVKGSKPPWFCVHGVGGGVIYMRHLIPYLDPGRPVYGIQPAFENDLPSFRTLEMMASDYVAEVRILQPKGPYYLGGSCFGGLVAREMARILHHEHGEEVALLLCIDPPWPTSDRARGSKLSNWVRIQTLKLLFRRTRRDAREIREQRVRSIGQNPFVHHFYNVHRDAVRDYKPGSSDVPMMIVGARWTRKRHVRMWGSVTPSGVEVQEVPALHSDLFLPTVAPILATYIQQALDEADRLRVGG